MQKYMKVGKRIQLRIVNSWNQNFNCILIKQNKKEERKVKIKESNLN